VSCPVPGASAGSLPHRRVLFCGALALNACTTLGPDYREPEVAWLSTWQPDLCGQVDTRGEKTAVDLRF